MHSVEAVGLTILTPTYNRAQTLTRLHESLDGQTCKEFQWLIIDDGSTDATENLVKGFVQADYQIEYHKKTNGGKHTAINFSHPYIRGDWVCIVDSDDWLLPSAVEDIYRAIDKYKQVDGLKCISFQRGGDTGDPICGSFPSEDTISNHIEFRVNGHRGGDCCEVISEDALREFEFPVHEGERFLGEGYLWNNVGFKYKTVYISKVIYRCEYLEGGLTKSGRSMRINCPLGGMDNSNSFFSGPGTIAVDPKVLRKEAMLFVCYGKFAGLGYAEIVDACKRPDLIRRYYCPGVLLYLYWNAKYR